VGIWWSRPSEGIYKKTLIQNVIERKKEKEDLAEEVRVLYVAFTRAMDKLILLGSMPGGAGRFVEGDVEPEGKSYMQLLMPIMKDTDIAVKSLDRAELSAWAGVASQQGGGQAIERLLMGEGASDGGPLAAEIARRLSFEYPYKEAAALKSKYSASELVKAAVQAGSEALAHVTASAGPEAQAPVAAPVSLTAPAAPIASASEAASAGPEAPVHVAAPAAAPPQNLDIPAVPAFMEGERKLSAAARGSAIHKIMELMDFREARMHAEEAGYFADMLKGMVEDGILAPAEAEAADLAKLRGFLKSDICRRAAESGSLRKEAPFVFRRVVGGEDILVQGVIDCFFKEAAGPEAGGGEAFILLDYKSGRLPSGANAGKSLAERAVERYGHQLRIYSEALEKIHGIPVAEAHLYLLDASEDVIVKITQ
jgi:ATP-dependent helicase/nuclease subunit A